MAIDRRWHVSIVRSFGSVAESFLRRAPQRLRSHCLARTNPRPHLRSEHCETVRAQRRSASRFVHPVGGTPSNQRRFDRTTLGSCVCSVRLSGGISLSQTFEWLTVSKLNQVPTRLTNYGEVTNTATKVHWPLNKGSALFGSCCNRRNVFSALTLESKMIERLSYFTTSNHDNELGILTFCRRGPKPDGPTTFKAAVANYR